MRLQHLRRFGHSEAGGAMIELAVVLPVLVLIAMGVLDYGKVFFRSVAVANAARAGAEWGAFSQDNYQDSTGIVTFAKIDGQDIATLKVTSKRVCRCGSTEVACTVTCSGPTPPRIWVESTATDTVTFVIKYPGLPQKFAITRTATFRNQ